MSVSCNLEVTGKGWPLDSLVYDVFLCFVTIPHDVLGQVCYMIVLIPDLCLLSNFYISINLMFVSSSK